MKDIISRFFTLIAATILVSGSIIAQEDHVEIITLRGTNTDYNLVVDANNETSSIQIKTENTKQKMNYKIVDMAGKEYYCTKLKSSDVHDIDISTYPKGTYYFTIKDKEDRENSYRIVKK